jgi:D,D-heptose 1,7-bisphosphate phosphatase
VRGHHQYVFEIKEMVSQRGDKKQAVFLDRDGVICREEGYLSDPRRLQLLPGSGDAIRLFNRNALTTVVITNQSGVARGFFPEAAIAEMNCTMKELLEEYEASLDGIYYCPHHPEGIIESYRKECDCRKPAAGLLMRAAQDHGIDLSRSYLVGDKRTDMECACRAGVKGILVLTGYGAEEYRLMPPAPGAKPVFVAQDLLDAARWIIQDIRSPNHEDTDRQAECHR